MKIRFFRKKPKKKALARSLSFERERALCNAGWAPSQPFKATHRNPSQNERHPKPRAKKNRNNQNHDFIKFLIFGMFWPFEASRPSKSSPGGQIMLVDKISAKMDGIRPLLSQNNGKYIIFREGERRKKWDKLIPLWNKPTLP